MDTGLIQNLVRKLNIVLGRGGKIYVRPLEKLTPALIAEITAAKPEIVAFLSAKKAAADLAHETREAKIAAIPGLDTLRSAIDAKEGYRHALTEAMESEENDGVRLPARPTADLTALATQYPLAALWLRAEDYLYSVSYRKSEAGRTAQALILRDEIGKAQEALENWLPKNFSD